MTGHYLSTFYNIDCALNKRFVSGMDCRATNQSWLSLWRLRKDIKVATTQWQNLRENDLLRELMERQ